MTNRRLELLRAELADARAAGGHGLALTTCPDGDPEGFLVAADGRLVEISRYLPNAGLHHIDELEAPKHDGALRQLVADHEVVTDWLAEGLHEVIRDLQPAIADWQAGTLPSGALEGLIHAWFDHGFHGQGLLPAGLPVSPWGNLRRVRLTKDATATALHRTPEGAWAYGPVVVATAGTELTADLGPATLRTFRLAVLLLEGPWQGRALGGHAGFDVLEAVPA